MIWVVAGAIATLVGAGVYLALARDVLRAVIGVSLIGTAANLVVLSAGRIGSTVSAIVPEGGARLAADAVNPLPQALVLTAIVISFSLTTFSVALVLALQRRTGVADSAQLNAAEPPAAADGYPAALEEERLG